ncbi:MAG: ribose-phosphate diphosphokinase [Phycisphaerae bacterium]
MTTHDIPTGPRINGLRIFGGTATPELTRHVCAYLHMEPGTASISRYPDGETLVKLEDDCRGRDCFVIQSTCPPVNEHLMELLILIDSLRRASARRITAVIPYYGYARQDRKSEGRTPITAKLVANMITTAGADRVLTMNLHADQIQGFFDIPVDNLTAAPVLTEHFSTKRLSRAVVLSPDVGNIKYSADFATRVGLDLAIIDKRRLSGESTRATNIIGDVNGKTVLMFDDMITTAGTVCEAARLARKHGAAGIHVGAAHGVFAGPALERLRAAELDAVVVTDTIPVHPQVKSELAGLTVLSVADLIGEAIHRIHEHRSVSALFS